MHDLVRPEPVTLVIFGGAGDLAHRKLLPALYNLHLDGLLPPRFAAVGTGRTAMTDAAYRAFAKDGVSRFSRRPLDEAAWQTFAESLFFVRASLDDATAFAPLGSQLDRIEHECGMPGNRIYFPAGPPAMFVATVKRLAEAGMVTRGRERPFARLIIEKPIGQRLDSPRELKRAIAGES